MPGSLSEKNEAAAAHLIEEATCLLELAGLVVRKSMVMDCGATFALVVENRDAVIYGREQIASGAAYDLEAVRSGDHCLSCGAHRNNVHYPACPEIDA